LKIALYFESTKKLAVRYQLRKSDFVVLAQGARFSDPLWKKMAIYKERKFVVMWAVPPYKQPEILFNDAGYLVGWGTVTSHESVYTVFAYFLGKNKLIAGLKNNLIRLFYNFYLCKSTDCNFG
jgi:hypothetical protein